MIKLGEQVIESVDAVWVRYPTIRQLNAQTWVNVGWLIREVLYEQARETA